jgi:hypothetical protein
MIEINNIQTDRNAEVHVISSCFGISKHDVVKFENLPNYEKKPNQIIIGVFVHGENALQMKRNFDNGILNIQIDDL